MSTDSLATLVAIHKLTHDVSEFVFKPNDAPPFAFQSGQYVMLVKAAEADEKKPTIRAYSIASSPKNSDTFSVIVNCVEGGRFTPWLFSLKAGDVVPVRGPKVHFVLTDQADKEFFFIATGTGIGPFRSMILDLLSRNSIQKITLLWGLRSERDLYLQEELADLSKGHSSFTAITTLSRPAGNWRGKVGRVTAYLANELESVDGKEFYLCGNGDMIKEVKEILGAKGPCDIHYEKYF